MDNKFIKEAEEFWKSIIYRDGKLDKEQILKELTDYYFLMKQVPKVYCAITGGKLSKLFYEASTIITEYEDNLNKLIDEAIEEYKEENKE